MQTKQKSFIKTFISVSCYIEYEQYVLIFEQTIKTDSNILLRSCSKCRTMHSCVKYKSKYDYSFSNIQNEFFYFSTNICLQSFRFLNNKYIYIIYIIALIQENEKSQAKLTSILLINKVVIELLFVLIYAYARVCIFENANIIHKQCSLDFSKSTVFMWNIKLLTKQYNTIQYISISLKSFIEN